MPKAHKTDNFILESVGQKIQIPHATTAYTRNVYLPIGNDNKLPETLLELYETEPILHACVDTLISFLPFSRQVSLSFLLYGACPLLWSDEHNKWSVLDHRYLRLNHDRTRFRYNLPQTGFYETFTDYASGGNVLYLALSDDEPYAITSTASYTSLISSLTLKTAQESLYCDVIDGFRPTTLVSFNNGTPPQAAQEEISDLVRSKFQSVNGNRCIISFSQDKDHAPEITSLQSDAYGEKYDTAVTLARNSIFTAFRLTPALAGVTEGMQTGFNENEYNAQFELFTRFTVRPLIDKISDLLGVDPDYSRIKNPLRNEEV